jgi:hypothetical protein
MPLLLLPAENNQSITTSTTIYMRTNKSRRGGRRPYLACRRSHGGDLAGGAGSCSGGRAGCRSSRGLFGREGRLEEGDQRLEGGVLEAEVRALLASGQRRRVPRRRLVESSGRWGGEAREPQIPNPSYGRGTTRGTGERHGGGGIYS